MTDLFLIAHKVRGEPAFDVAERMTCPECHGQGGEHGGAMCVECEALGYWWIIPTSGHRAYPWWDMELKDLSYMWDSDHASIMKDMPEMPNGWPDHYPTRHSTSPRIDISTLIAPAVEVKINRRF